MALTDGPYDGEFLVSEAPGRQSRDIITLKQSVNTLASTILGKVTVGAATPAAVAGNTGTGVLGAVTVSAGAKVGIYKVMIVEPAGNAGSFIVEDPDGVIVGSGTVAVLFNKGGLSFTLADNVDFVSGDSFTITVAAGSGKFVALDLAGADGSQRVAGILWATTDASAADKTAVAVVRNAEVNSAEIIYPSGANDNQKAAIRAELALLGIIVRTGVAGS